MLSSFVYRFCSQGYRLPERATGADTGSVITDKLSVVSFASLSSRVKVRQSTACVSLYTSLLSGFCFYITALEFPYPQIQTFTSTFKHLIMGNRLDCDNCLTLPGIYFNGRLT